MYKHLFFDLDNTIWNFDLNSFHALKKVYLDSGLPLEEYSRFFNVYNRHNDHLWELYRKNEIKKQELASARFDLTFQELGISGFDGSGFNTAYLDHMPLQTRVCDGAHEVLERLSVRFKMHIITNGFREVQYKKLENSNLRHFFQRVFISEEVKAQKPSEEIFIHALKSANARKKESLMIGDSWDVDILGAMGAGIDQVHYAPHYPDAGLTPEEQHKSAISGTKTIRILALKELLTYLRIPA